MEKFVENYVKEIAEKDKTGYHWNLIEQAIKTEMSGIITLDWSCLKWYDGYKDVDAIMYSLDELSNKDIDYQYMRIGEENDDIEERWEVNNDSFDSFYVSRTFEG